MLHQIHAELQDSRKRNSVVNTDLDLTKLIKSVNKRLESTQLTDGEEETKEVDEVITADAKKDTEDTEKPEDSKTSETEEPPKSETSTQEETDVSSLFGIQQKVIHRCLKCNEKKLKENVLLVCNLLYPISNESYDFIKLLGDSMNVEMTLSAWCDPCNRFSPHNHHARIIELPSILAINCGLDNEKELDSLKKFLNQMTQEPNHSPVNEPLTTKACRYGTKCSRPDCHFSHPQRIKTSSESSSNGTANGKPCDRWFPLSFKILINESENISISEIDIKTDQENADSNNIYSLQAAVYCIDDGQQRNLISFISLKNEWFMFNDFCIKKVSEAEVLCVLLDWKIPTVLFYRRNNFEWDEAESVTYESPFTSNLLFEEKFFAKFEIDSSNFLPLSKDEIPKKGEKNKASGGTNFIVLHFVIKTLIFYVGDLVAMDAEFVTLNPEESEISSDGKMTIKPRVASVARVSCIRG